MRICEFVIKPQSILFKSYHSDYQYNLVNKSKYQSKPTNMKYTGKLSPATSKRLQKILYVWLLSVYLFKIYNSLKVKELGIYPVFITLTLADKQFHGDKYIKENLLKPFLRKIKIETNFHNYFWRAEKQKNNNIHFHVIIDKYIDMKYLNRSWNFYLKKFGYTTKYFSKFRHHFPPSTHIRKIDNIGTMTKYCIKYAAKNETNLKVDGRQYSFSNGLEKLNYASDDLTHQLENELSEYLQKTKNNEYENTSRSIQIVKASGRFRSERYPFEITDTHGITVCPAPLLQPS